MTAPVTLDGTLAALRENEVRLLMDIAATIREMGDGTQQDSQRLVDVAEDLRDLFFMVAVIGEFNAGKSSLINALLGDELLPTGITPTTEMIEVIRYGETPDRRPQIRDESTRVWTHPNTGAPGVALVDTPGTGSVFSRHERTAKEFLHRSDMVIFVLSAKRALAETERLYLELARTYGKKILMVVNQVDLLQPNEQQEVRRFVERQLQELLEMRPLIFMTSSREALAAQRSDAAARTDAGGIGALRAHLQAVFSEVPPAKQKLLAQLEMAKHIVERYLDKSRSGANGVTSDTQRVQDVQKELEQQSSGLETQLKAARVEIDQVFEGLRQRGRDFIDANLSVRRLGRGVDKETLQREFREVVIGRALRDINDASSDYVNALIDNSRLYWRGVIDRLNQLRGLLEQEVTGLDAGVYTEQREALQRAIQIAETELKSYSSGQVLADLQTTFEHNLSNFTTSVVAALLGLIVALLAVLTPGPLVGAGAAALALPALIIGAPAAVVGGYFALRYYRKVTADARRDLLGRIDHLQKTYYDSLDNLTQKERTRLLQYGKQVLTPVFSRLEVLSQRFVVQQSQLREHLDALQRIRASIESS